MLSTHARRKSSTIGPVGSNETITIIYLPEQFHLLPYSTNAVPRSPSPTPETRFRRSRPPEHLLRKRGSAVANRPNSSRSSITTCEEPHLLHKRFRRGQPPEFQPILHQDLRLRGTAPSPPHHRQSQTEHAQRGNHSHQKEKRDFWRKPLPSRMRPEVGAGTAAIADAPRTPTPQTVPPWPTARIPADPPSGPARNCAVPPAPPTAPD